MQKKILGSNILGIFFIIILNYIFICISLYTLSAFLLIKNITPDLLLIRDFQRNFYHYSGIRKIWQSNNNCIEFDKDLIYMPKNTSCIFSNIEYKTNLSFDIFGRFSDHPVNYNNNGIIVLGDSHAMGWGVNDNETFSAILESKINRPVYNLAVSGYGTPRELLRLEKSNLIDKTEIVIIQYCYNDYGENKDFKINNENIAKEKYKIVTKSNSITLIKKLRKFFRYSLSIPIELLTSKNQSMNFDTHKSLFEARLKETTILKNKKIIVFYVNGYDMKFSNFPNEKSKNIKNLYYYDLNIDNEYTFNIDGHLNSSGHNYIAEKLYKILKER